MEHWTKTFNDSNDVHIIYLDFCKASDHVSHQFLLSKLKVYGIVLNWVMSFLSKKCQTVNINGYVQIDATLQVVFHRGVCLALCFLLSTSMIYLKLFKA